MASKPFDQDKLNRLRLEAYEEVERLEIEVKRLRKDKMSLQSMLIKVRKNRDSYKLQVNELRSQLDRALGELARRPLRARKRP